MIKKLKGFYFTLKENVFQKYPVTICVIWVAAILSAINVHIPYDGKYYELLQRLTGFIWIFAAGDLLVEEFFESHKRIFRIIGFVISAIISAAFIHIGYMEQEYILGIDTDIVKTYTAKIMVCYLTWIAMLCIFWMYKNSKVSFEKYCLSVFGSVMRTSIVYGMFALGLAVIIWIFNILIFDTDDFILRIEALLACGLYIPGLILAFSKVKEEIGKFLCVVVKYVLMILAMAAMVIIYLYIIKLAVSRNLPSNELFSIFSWLFACGLPIWTMGMYFKEEKIGKIAAILPYVFIPFIILQAICIGIRVHEYGLTDSRYLCCFLILGEVIYLVLLSVKGRKFLPTIFIVVAGMVTIFCLAPIINSDTMVYLSQKSRFEKLMQKADSGEELSQKEIKCVLGAYRELKYLQKGEDYVENLPSSYVEFLDSCREEEYYSDRDFHDYSYIYMNFSTKKYGFDVTDHRTVYTVNLSAEANGYNEPVDLKNVTFEIANEKTVIDLTDFAVSAWEYYESSSKRMNSDEWIYQNGRIQLPGGAEIVIYDVNEHFRDDICIYFDADAYYLD